MYTKNKLTGEILNESDIMFSIGLYILIKNTHKYYMFHKIQLFI